MKDIYKEKDHILLLIHWVDSASTDSIWIEPEASMVPTLKCKSIGWLVGEDEESITIAAHWHRDEVGGNMTIPKVAITGQWEITI